MNQQVSTGATCAYRFNAAERSTTTLTSDNATRQPLICLRAVELLHAATTAGAVLDAGFDLLPTFRPPHYSVVLPAYTVASALALSDVLGDPIPNSFYERSEPR